MKLLIGRQFLGAGYSDTVEIFENGNGIAQFDLAELRKPQSGALAPFLQYVEEVEIGFANLHNLDFLEYIPKVVHVHIRTSNVTDIDGLRHSREIKSLNIERAKCRMDVLGQLDSLESIYLDEWRPGADSIFRLQGLTKARFRKFPYENFAQISHWNRLKELWISAGRLVEVVGIPPGIESLEFTHVKNLRSLSSLGLASLLTRLIIINCRQLRSLTGIEGCHNLEILSLAKVGKIETLEPIRNLRRLKYVFLADGTLVEKGVETLYGLPKLEKLVISKQSRIDSNIMQQIMPGCKLVLAS